ncbi:hypothetical protein GCM10029964_048040 [Kibdelosporangium lantanae]
MTDRAGEAHRMAQRLNAAARDAAVRRVKIITTGVVAVGVLGTLGLGVAIAAGTPDKPATTTSTVAHTGYGEE